MFGLYFCLRNFICYEWKKILCFPQGILCWVRNVSTTKTIGFVSTNNTQILLQCYWLWFLSPSSQNLLSPHYWDVESLMVWNHRLLLLWCLLGIYVSTALWPWSPASPNLNPKPWLKSCIPKSESEILLSKLAPKTLPPKPYIPKPSSKTLIKKSASPNLLPKPCIPNPTSPNLHARPASQTCIQNLN